MGYGKFFTSCFTGSMFGAGPVVFAVWAYVIAHTIDGQIELNPKFLAATIGCAEEEINKAIAYLCSPDPESRNKEFDGKRLLKEGQFAYQVVSHDIYRAMQDEEERRVYNRLKQKAYRERMKEKNGKRSRGNALPKVTESNHKQEAEAEAKVPPLESPKGTKNKKFIKPSIEECRINAKEIGIPEGEGDLFFHHHEARGWMLKTGQMKSWKSAMQTWKHNYEQGRFNARTERVGGSAETASDRRNAFMGLTREDELAAGKRMEEKLKRDEAARDRATAEWRRKYENEGSNAGLQPELPSSGQSVPKPENHPHRSNGSGQNNSNAEGLRMDGRNPLGSVASELEVHPKKEVEGF